MMAAANLRRSTSPRKFPVSGRSHWRAEVAVALDMRRWHQNGDPVEQLEWSEDQRAACAGAWLRVVVDEVLVVVLAQPV